MIIEVLILVPLGKKLAAILERKGRDPYNFVYVFVLLWFAGEIGGFVLAAFLPDPSNPDAVHSFSIFGYAVALMCAAIVSSLGFVFAEHAAPNEEVLRRTLAAWDDADEEGDEAEPSREPEADGPRT